MGGKGEKRRELKAELDQQMMIKFPACCCGKWKAVGYRKKKLYFHLPPPPSPFPNHEKLPFFKKGRKIWRIRQRKEKGNCAHDGISKSGFFLCNEEGFSSRRSGIPPTKEEGRRRICPGFRSSGSDSFGIFFSQEKKTCILGPHHSSLYFKCVPGKRVAFF